MGNKSVQAAAIMLSLCVLASCKSNGEQPISSPEISTGSLPSSPTPLRTQPAVHIDKEEQELYTFIAKQLTGPYGVYTNLQDTGQTAEVATGHEVLSESASLMMRIAVLNGNKELFSSEWAKAKQTFSIEGGFSYRYSPKLQKQYPLNAAVDDLRLIGALYAAGDTFDNKEYTNEAAEYSKTFYRNNVKDGYMYDFYDNDLRVTNDFVTLCYINLDVLQNLSIDDEIRGILLHNMNTILEDGYLSDEFPFYETRFNYKTGNYSSEKINTVESLLSILNLAEVDRQKPQSIRYIKEQVEAGTLYGQYTRDGQPANDIRSTAIYALTAIIGAEIGDDSLYSRSIERMNEFRVTDTGSVLYGGFGNPETGQAYSFDNLMALLAYSY